MISEKANFDDTQRDLQHTCDWASAWDLPLNENKCGHISISSAPTLTFTRSDNGNSRKLLDSTKDLGIFIDSSIKAYMNNVTALGGKWDLYHLDGVLASQYQSSDWNQQTTN